MNRVLLSGNTFGCCHFLYTHLRIPYGQKHGFLPSLHCGFIAPDAVAYRSVGDSVQALKLVKLSRAPIVFARRVFEDADIESGTSNGNMPQPRKF